MEEEKIIDQTKLAEDLANKIPYSFRDSFLLKPLEPIKVQKEFTKLPEDGTPTEDKNGIEAVDYKDEDIKTEIKEVDSDYRKGVVLKVPYEAQQQMDDPKYPSMQIKVGDIVIYREREAIWFDLVKDTQLIRYYGIIGLNQ